MILPPIFQGLSFSGFLAATSLSSRPLKLAINLMALLFWISSMLCTLHLVDRSHTTSAYSTIGLHRLAYASSLASWGALCMRCLIPPSIYFAKAFDDKVLHQLLMKQCCEVVPNITIIISHH